MDQQQKSLRWRIGAPLGLVLLVLLLALGTPESITRYYLKEQDTWLLAAAGAIAVAVWYRLTGAGQPIDLTGRAVAGLAVAAGVIGYAGHYWLLDGYDLTRDEQMATFDARIIASGRLAWPLQHAWQGSAAMLNTTFMPLVEHPVAWVSGYLPGNAALRALIGKVADPALTGPLLTGGAIALTWLCARRLWPHEREPAAIATLLTALSGQVLLTGMTAYAMPAHLFCNLLWLWLFLADRRGTDLAALAVGALATGLHQPIFHPLFVAPWLAGLLVRRDWSRLAVLVAGYGVIGLFWLAWPHWQTAAMTGPDSVPMAGGDSLLHKVAALIAGNGGGLFYMGANLLRFMVWQPVALVPLLFAGWLAARRDARAAALAGGIVLTVLAMTLLLAFQGHGFGYRYLHGQIGSAALLAAFGWRELDGLAARLRPALRRSLIGGVLILLPLQAVFAHRFYAPYATANRRIMASHADFAVIGAQDAPYALDLVINRPDLSNRPLRLIFELTPPPAILASTLCRPGISVALPQGHFYDSVNTMFGTWPNGLSDHRARALAPALRAAGCRVIPLD